MTILQQTIAPYVFATLFVLAVACIIRLHIIYRREVAGLAKDRDIWMGTAIFAMDKGQNAGEVLRDVGDIG